MTILVTGGAGYLGRRVCRELTLRGDRIVVLVRSTTNIEKLNALPSSLIDIVRTDKEDGAIASVFRSFAPITAVVHCATCYGRKEEGILSVLQTNLLFSLNVLIQSVQAGCPFFLNIASLLPKNLNPYALSKAQFSEWGRFLTQKSSTFFMDAAIEYMYGGTLEEGGFLSRVISDLLDKVPVLELTSGEQKRDFVHVDDVAQIIAYLTEKQDIIRGKNCHLVQIGTGKSISMREIIELIADLCDAETDLRFGAIPYRVGENMSMRADISVLKKLGYPFDGLRNARDGIVEYVESARCIRVCQKTERDARDINV